MIFSLLWQHLHKERHLKKKQQDANDKAKAKQDATLAKRKMSRGDNRGFNFSNSGGKHDDGKTPNKNINPDTGKPLTIQEQNWNDVVNHGTTLGKEKAKEESERQRELALARGGSIAGQKRRVTVSPQTSQQRDVVLRSKQIREEIQKTTNG